MQAERSHLRNVVLPALEEWLRGKRKHIEWIDLRVGVPGAEIANEAERETLVLKVCFEGVERSRPFLIALIGDRYGWIPPQERAERAIQEIPDASFSTALADRSVTDLEIEFGAFHEANQAKRCLFFFRKPLPYGKMGETAGKYSEDYSSEADAADKKLKLLALKARIQGAFRPQCFDYEAAWDGNAVSGLEVFGDRVEAEIKKVLEAELAAAPELVDLTVEDLDRLELADFAEDRAHEFVGRNGLLADLERHITSEPKEGAPRGLCVTGESGSGKSALFGALVQGLTHTEKAPLTERFQTTDVLVLAHAAGASPRAASVDVMLLRWIGELAAFLGVTPNLPENPKPDDIDAAFASLLGRAALKKRVVVLLDALDQFEPTPRGRFVTWLPKLWHENARLIATAIPGDASEALAKRPAITFKPIPPLGKEDAEKIAANISKHYGRTLESKVVAALLGGERWRNPLWLALATEEVNLVDADDFARAKTYQGGEAEKLRDMMADRASGLPPDVPGLYRETFSHAAELFGAKTAEAFLGLIAVGRVGWRESDFRVVLPKVTGKDWDELEFAQLRRSFRGQLRQRGQGQWDFTHAQMRPAVKAWLKDTAGISETALHTALGDHLLALPANDPVHVSETMMHLMECEASEYRAAHYYGDQNLSLSELDGADRVLRTAYLVLMKDNRHLLRKIERLLGNSDGGSPVGGHVAYRLLYGPLADSGLSVTSSDRYRLSKAAEVVFARLGQADMQNLVWHRGFACSLTMAGDSLFAQGHLDEALKSFNQCQSIFDDLAAHAPENNIWMSDQNTTLSRIGDVLAAQGKLSEAIEVWERGLSIANRLVRLGIEDGSTRGGTPDFLLRLGDAQSSRGSLSKALEAYRNGLNTSVSLANKAREKDYWHQEAYWQRHVSLFWGRIGDINASMGDIRNAEESYRTSLSVAEILIKSVSGSADYQRVLAGAYSKLALFLPIIGKVSEALEVVDNALPLLKSIVDTDTSNSTIRCDIAKLGAIKGKLHLHLGKSAEAKAILQESLRDLERLAKGQPDDFAVKKALASLLGMVGEVRVATGAVTEALGAYSAQRTICDEILQQTDDISMKQEIIGAYTNIGEQCLVLGKYEEARSAFLECLARAKSLVEFLPTNEIALNELTKAQNRVANFFITVGDQHKAGDMLRQALATAQTLTNSNPINTVWQIQLAEVWGMTGELKARLGDMDEAIKAFGESASIIAFVLTGDVSNAGLKRRLGYWKRRMGDVLGAEFKVDEALEVYREVHSLIEPLMNTNTCDAICRYEYSVLEGRIGDALAYKKEVSSALAAYESSRSVLVALQKHDPSNIIYQADAAFFSYRVAHMSISNGDAVAALHSFKDARDAFNRLLNFAPQNESWQRVLLATDIEIADIYLQQGAVGDALIAANEAVEIAERRKQRYNDAADTEVEYRGARAILQLCLEKRRSEMSSAPEVKTEPVDDPGVLLARVRSALERGDAAWALNVLMSREELGGARRELTGVCQMRLGNVREAVNSLHNVLFPNDETSITDSTSPKLFANYATAQLLTGDIRGAKHTLDQVWDKNNPAISRLLDAIDRWEQSLSFAERMKWRFGGAPPKPFHLDPPYGEI